MPPELNIKPEKDIFNLDKSTIERMSRDALTSDRLNVFYGKNVFFTREFESRKYVVFQIIGNLGGMATIDDLNNDIDFVILANDLIDKIGSDEKSVQLELVEKLLASKFSKKTNSSTLNIIAERDFIASIRKRCELIGDKVTAKLLEALH